MGKGGYNGGSTIIRPGSDWFAESDAKAAKRKPPTIEELARSAVASADRVEKRRKQSEAQIAEWNASPDAARKDAIKRSMRRKTAKRRGQT